MAVKETFALNREQTHAYLSRQLDEIEEVQISEVDGAGAAGFQLFLTTTPLLRKKKATNRLQAELVLHPGEDEDHTVVVLEDVESPPWLYRRLVRIIESQSLARKQAEESRRDSPFSMENMWGMGPAAASAPAQKSLGFGGDFFGCPKSRRPPKGAIADTPPADDPGAFTIARDRGDF